MIPIYAPYLNENILKYAHQAIDSTWISSKGRFLEEATYDIANFYEHRKLPLLCSNGTTAMHLLARCLKKYHPHIKKIIVQNNVYVAAWNAFLFDQSYELEAVDASVDTWNYDLDLLYDVLGKQNIEETALLVVHNVGNIINVPKIQRDWPGLVVVEDNCEGFGGTYEDMRSGEAAVFSAISFFGNKNITSGEGGAIILNTQEEHDFAFCLHGQGQSSKRFIHDELGYNYRMTNIQAAILHGQMLAYSEIADKKRKLFAAYQSLLENVEDVVLPQIEPGTTHSNWMFGIRVLNGNYSDMESFFNERAIEVRPMFYPMTSHKYLGHIKQNGLKVAKQLNQECLILPSYPDLKDHEIYHVVQTLKCYVEGVK
jgi:perosamine synthetase